MNIVTTEAIEAGATVTVEGYRGVAFRVDGWAEINVPIMCLALACAGCGNVGEHEHWCDVVEFTEEVEVESDEWETTEDQSRVVVHMVGDDRRFTVEVEAVEVLAEDGYCHGCGQIGCQWDTES